VADTYGRPVAFTLTPGNIADIAIARPLLGTLEPSRRLLADKAYDADSLRTWLKQRGTTPVVPSTAARKRPYPLDRNAYKRRNLIERLFCRLKDWRRIATRYDRLAQNYLSALALVASRRRSASNYLCNPMLKLAREMINAGELGEVRSHRGVHA